ncbi:MAG: hypothetical protein O3C21_15305 [Verrucomicrobia bacterium]|nr:hypothetical protein [Verrucomicrobiota bacterium]
MSGELLTKLTVWAAVTAYSVACAGTLLVRAGEPRPSWIRWAWTIGLCLFLLHVCCAFGFYHSWSHADAYSETARQTAAMTGMHWGGGLYFNYLFATLWLADVAWLWIAPDSHARRPRMISTVFHGFLFFLVVNGTVVFIHGPMRWYGLVLCGALVGFWLRRWRAFRALAIS